MEGSRWGTHVYLWWIHFDIWQNQYNIVKFKNKIKLKKKKKNYRNSDTTTKYSLAKLFTCTRFLGYVKTKNYQDEITGLKFLRVE